MSFFSLDRQQGPVWMDGRLVDWSSATLHVLSHGLNNASCVFEGERAYGGKIFKLREHTQRLFGSAEILGIRIPYSLDALCQATQEVVRAQNLSNGYVRPVVWRGHEDLGIAAPNAQVHVAIAALACDDVVPPQARERGVSLKVSKWVRPAPHMAPLKAKASCHYVLGSLAIQEAKAAGHDDALLLDYRGYVAESTGSNFFFVKDGCLHTPLTECALDGITRRTVIELARGRGLSVQERDIHPEEILSAQEAFLTGTAVEVLPVRQIDARELETERPVTTALIRDYCQRVGKEQPGY
jgi:branched-chain amino acid aminotransferase